MGSIQYDFEKKRVKQVLGVAISSFYDLDGDFEGTIKYLENKKEYYNNEFVKKPSLIKESNYSGGAYIDGETKKEVRFDTLILDCRRIKYEDGFELVVIGERDMLPEELEAVNKKKENERSTLLEKELKEFERLKKKYEGR